MRKWLIPAATATVLLGGTIVVAGSVADRSMEEGTAVVEGCRQPPGGFRTVTAGAATEPVCVDGTWSFSLPARAVPSTTRRTEVFLADRHGEIVGGEGDDIVHDVVVTPHLGPSGAGDASWHVLWQLHGPTAGEWRPPPVTLNIRAGALAVSGGAGHPAHEYGAADHEWVVPLTEVSNGTPYHVRIVVHLSSNPELGWISAGIDGRQVLNRWRPRSPDGLRPGTLYPGQTRVASRMGLYRGSQSELPPRYEQKVLDRVLETSTTARSSGRRP